MFILETGKSVVNTDAAYKKLVLADDSGSRQYIQAGSKCKVIQSKKSVNWTRNCYVWGFLFVSNIWVV